ncbi:MAG: adenylate/guanylate cyclase domain-containing protein [Planctomycetota bacterium]|nr:adenylate/guanylate cyclase domain-containing protein [Planctomycetota bacterium]
MSKHHNSQERSATVVTDPRRESGPAKAGDSLSDQSPRAEAGALTGSARDLLDRIGSAERVVSQLEQSQVLSEALAEIADTIHQSQSLSEAFARSVEKVVATLKARRGMLLIRNEEGELVTRASKNFEQTIRSARGQNLPMAIARHVVQGLCPILAPDARSHPGLGKFEVETAAGLGAVMCLPIVDKNNEGIGAIYLDGTANNPMFCPDGMEFLRRYAGYIGTAMVHKDLIERNARAERNWDKLRRYFAEDVAASIVAGDQSVEMGGDTRVVTVLFADIRGWTTLLEQLKPSEAVEMLNDYFSGVVDDLLAEKGTLDKFTGDGIMAFWGAPTPLPDHALRAVRAAVKMQARLPVLRMRWRQEGRSFAPKTERLMSGVGIGIHTGEVVVGNIGSPRRMEYTAIGDTVNVTARIQGVAKGGEVLITEETLDLIRDSVFVEALEPVKVKGRKQAITLYRLEGVR